MNMTSIATCAIDAFPFASFAPPVPAYNHLILKAHICARNWVLSNS